MSVDLRRYIDFAESAQPEAVTAAFKRLCVALPAAEDAVAWERTTLGYIDEAREWITTGFLDGENAAGAIFVGHALSGGYRALGRESGLRILGFVMQLAMSEAQWAGALKAMAADGFGGCGRDNKVLRIDRFPETLLSYLVKRSEVSILREIFRSARLAIDGLALRAMRDAHDFGSWIGDLAVLAAYLTMRRWLPLTLGQDDNPILVQLFDRAEIETLHRKEAFAAECFAHLFTSVSLDCVSPEYQQSVAEEYARLEIANRIEATEWLCRGKSRFQIAPYVGAGTG